MVTVLGLLPALRFQACYVYTTPYTPAFRATWTPNDPAFRATFLQSALQALLDIDALVQLLPEDLPQVVVHVAGLQQLLEGPAQLLQLVALQGTQPAALLDLLPQLGQLPGLGLDQSVHPGGGGGRGGV